MINKTHKVLAKIQGKQENKVSMTNQMKGGILQAKILKMTIPRTKRKIILMQRQVLQINLEAIKMK